MPNPIRIKRRAAGGAAGAPSALLNAELAFNEQDDTLYYGKGDTAGTATQIIAIGGPGTFARLNAPTFTGVPAAPTAAADTNTTQIATTAFLIGQASATNPAMNGTVAIGTSLRYARADHVHASDTSRAPLASPTFTGTPAAPTAAANTNTTQIATTAFVLAQGNATAGTIAMNGTQAAGSSNLYARADHVHPSDTSRAPLASPTFTGTPAAPTAANGTNTTQIATTAYVLATRLDQFAAPTTTVGFGSQRLINVADPTNAQDAATKNYVDNAIAGLDPKPSVLVATTANITLSAPQTIDGIAVVAGDRVLVKNQSTLSQNGIYVVAAGAWTRATDMNTWAEVVSAYTWVERGTAHGDQGWVCTADQGGTLDSTAISWSQFNGSGGSAYTAGNGLTLNANQFSVVADGSTITVSGTGIKVSDTYPGNTSLVTLGAVTTGTWSASTIAVARGGTGLTAAPNGLIKGNGTTTYSAAVAGTDYHDTSSTIDGGTF